MKKIILSSALLISVVNADFIGAEIGISSWSNSIDGNFKYNGTSINSKSDLGLDRDNNMFIWASFEHPVPLIPNIKIQHTKSSYNSTKILSNDITFGSKKFDANSKLKSEISLTQTDLIAYYEILDNYVSIDLGLNLKILNANFRLQNDNYNEVKDFTAPIPMVYSKAKIELPLTGLSAEAELSYISISDSTFYDAQASIGYETAIGLGAKVGYRKENLDISDIKDTNANLTFDGAFASLYYHF